ncbi:hypothetical protein C6A37_07740 [Desulfobacteraceae bacterium SEEP-SAG9]|nr:hypothetical protein C6A37_07740 [Desulfobacteraceae bacterium SEEP-SAG9]
MPKVTNISERTFKRSNKGASDILIRQEVAEIYRLPLKTLDYLVRTGQIPFSRIGKRGVRFSRVRLEQWFQDQEGIAYRLNGKN